MALLLNIYSNLNPVVGRNTAKQNSLKEERKVISEVCHRLSILMTFNLKHGLFEVFLFLAVTSPVNK